ncbi:MAG: Tic22 family protein [Armatimonadaceae bacterium]|jgi:hypothetical protein
MFVFSALALLALVVGPPNTRQPTLQVPAVKAPELPPSLVQMTSAIPFFVIANEKGELYLLRFKGNPRPTLAVHSTPEEAEKLRAQVSIRDAKMGARLAIRMVSMAEVLRWNLDPRFPYTIAVVAPPEDIAAGSKSKLPGQADPIFPVFLIRNVKENDLLTLQTKDGNFVPALFSYRDASGMLSELRKGMGKSGNTVQIQAVDLARFLETVRSEAGPRAQTYKIAAPQSALEFAKKLSDVAPPKDPRKR